MADNLVITIGLVETLTMAATLAGTLIVLAWRASARLTRVETLIEGMDKRLTLIEGNSIGAFKSQSPITLTERGRQLLSGSGLKTFIDESQSELKKLIKVDDDELETDYDVQTVAFDFFDSLQFDQTFEKELKQFAYEQGVSMAVLRRIAGIYFRDQLLAASSS